MAIPLAVLSALITSFPLLSIDALALVIASMVVTTSSIQMVMESLMLTMCAKEAMTTLTRIQMGNPMHVTMMMTMMVSQMDLINVQTRPLEPKSIPQVVR